MEKARAEAQRSVENIRTVLESERKEKQKVIEAAITRAEKAEKEAKNAKKEKEKKAGYILFHRNIPPLKVLSAFFSIFKHIKTKFLSMH